MSIKYDIYENPLREEDGEILFHARVVNKGTISSRELESEIEYSTSLTEGDVKGVMSALSHLLIKHLSQGERVHIDGLGYFQLSINSPIVKNAKELRGDHLSVRTIKFFPEKNVKTQLTTVKFERTKRKNHSQKHLSEDIEKLLESYFQEHTYITRAEFQKISGLTRATAISRLNKLIEEGKIIKGGIKGSPVYEWKNKED